MKILGKLGSVAQADLPETPYEDTDWIDDVPEEFIDEDGEILWDEYNRYLQKERDEVFRVKYEYSKEYY